MGCHAWSIGGPTASGGGAPEFTLQADGNLVITGSIITGSPRCRHGCDEVFHPGYEIEPIEQYATAMWEKSYPPAIGPTRVDKPIDLTEKVGCVLTELEKAHIYIERLHERGKEKEERIKDLENRLSRLEAFLGRGSGD